MLKKALIKLQWIYIQYVTILQISHRILHARVCTVSLESYEHQNFFHMLDIQTFFKASPKGTLK